MFFVLFVLGAVFFLLLVSGSYVFIVACRRTKELNWLEPEKLKGTAYEKYSPLIQQSHQWLVDHGAQDVFIQSRDGLKLHGLYVPAENAHGTVLFAHGYRSTCLVDFGLAFPLYHDMGLNLLIPDQRSHGGSEGKFITFGVRESEDMLCWIEYHNRVYGPKPMLLSGMSMGASTVMFLADENLPDNVRCMVTDCGFSSPRQIIASVFKQVTHLPAGPSLWVTDALCRLFAGFRLDEKDSRQTLGHSHIPILMIHGTADTFVPCQMSRQGYAACAAPKRLLLVEGAEHGTSFLVDEAHYREAIMDLLHANMEEIA